LEKNTVEDSLAHKVSSLFKKKCKQAEVAKQMNVSRQTASRWYKRWCKEGAEGLKGIKGSAGRKSKTEEILIERLECLIIKENPTVFGRPKTKWTLSELATIAKKEFNINYSRSQLLRILRKRGITYNHESKSWEKMK